MIGTCEGPRAVDLIIHHFADSGPPNLGLSPPPPTARRLRPQMPAPQIAHLIRHLSFKVDLQRTSGELGVWRLRSTHTSPIRGFL